MEKAQVLHSLTKNFNVSEQILKELLSQIEDENYKNNFARITKGLSVEDNYKMIFGVLPWVKNINGLDQNQEKKHKVDFQCPDYSLLIENSQKENFPLLVDVKSVKGEKRSIKLIPKQMHSLKNYARNYNAPLLVAIYWEKIGYWTHNCLSAFEGKKKNSLSIESAIMNDLSHILSDYTFIIDSVFYRKTYFSDSLTESGAKHNKYGYFKDVLIGKSLSNLENYSIIESSIIDSTFIMEEIEFVDNGKERYLIESLKISTYPVYLKTSQVITNSLRTWQVDHDFRIDEVAFTDYARIHLVELMKDLNYKLHYLIPRVKTKETDRLFEKAYFNTVVMNTYNKG